MTSDWTHQEVFELLDAVMDIIEYSDPRELGKDPDFLAAKNAWMEARREYEESVDGWVDEAAAVENKQRLLEASRLVHNGTSSQS